MKCTHTTYKPTVEDVLNINGNFFISTADGYYNIPSYYSSLYTLNAANLARSVVGDVFFEGDGSKTISAAGGGSIFFATESQDPVTFDNPGTVLRVGITDVNASGTTDYTWSVYGELIGGTDTIPILTMKEVAMSSGTKTIRKGEKIALTIRMISRAGSDSIKMQGLYLDRGYPYGIQHNGVSASRNENVLKMAIKFDDGTTGFIQNILPSILDYPTAAQYNEYGLVFKLPFSADLNGVMIPTSSTAFGSDPVLLNNPQIRLYSNPLTTPVLDNVIQIQPGESSGDGYYPYQRFFNNPTRLLANTYYVISQTFPTNPAPEFLGAVYNMNSGNEDFKLCTQLGLDWSYAFRADYRSSNSFVVTEHLLPALGMFLSNITY